MRKKAIIIGAGPAGLTAAYELLKRTDIVPIIIEKSGDIGGISKTVNYKGNRMDIGGHRFFSKSDRVMQWWLNIMPIEPGHEDSFSIKYRGQATQVHPKINDPGIPGVRDEDKMMLVRRRLSRIYFLRKFFTYPIQMSVDTLKKLGVLRTIKILISYLKAQLFPKKPEKNLEDFFINRFGKELYSTFFKDYTEKVWGISCKQISAQWGAQRIKGISIGKAIKHAVKNLMPSNKRDISDILQKNVETSLIENFLYPKFGPGQLWEEAARQVQEMGGTILMNCDVHKIQIESSRVTAVEALKRNIGEILTLEGDYFFSTMPVKELIAGMGSAAPSQVQEIANGLQYRDFITVGVLLSKMPPPDARRSTEQQILPDTWIYIQEKDVKVGRLQIFNNWSPYMVRDPNTVWVGMEYFCNQGDEFWCLTDHDIQSTAIAELEKMGLASVLDVLDSTVLRMEKTYPAYFGAYNQFSKISDFTDRFANLFLIGRNGMHKYNNSDHSMLTAMVAVDNIIAGVESKTNIWSINTEQEYHEEKTASVKPTTKEPKRKINLKPLKMPDYNALPSFKSFIWDTRESKRYTILFMAVFLTQFIVFKLIYPFANYMPDSYAYLDSASNNLDVNVWPVGYSKFLRLLSVFSHSDTFVVFVQYLLLQAGSYCFLFTILYFFQPSKGIRIALQVFFLFNPIMLYMANYISADSLFIGLSLFWISTIIWIVLKPRTWQIWLQAILLLIAFTVRYNAIYYPIITVLAYLISRQSWKLKVSGIALSLVFVGYSVIYTSNKTYVETGYKQFSPFGGWQLANNALYMYQHIPPGERKPAPKEFSALEAMVRQHMDTLSKVRFSHYDSIYSYFYLWSKKGPLIEYMNRKFHYDSTSSYFQKWSAEGPLYSSYGYWLIRNYPGQFLKYFALPNSVKFAAPPEEFLASYNMGLDEVKPAAKDWFNYKTTRVADQVFGGDHIGLPQWYVAISAFSNIVLLLGAIGMLMLGALKWKDYGLPQLLLLVLIFWLANSGFSILASPIVMRYQLFPIILFFAFAMIITGKIYNLSTTSSSS